MLVLQFMHRWRFLVRRAKSSEAEGEPTRHRDVDSLSAPLKQAAKNKNKIKMGGHKINPRDGIIMGDAPSSPCNLVTFASPPSHVVS